jgi:hypothetical protein
LFFLFVFYLALARVIAEAGLVDLDLPINAHAFTVGIVGSSNLPAADLTVLGLGSAFARNWRTFTMVGISHVAWFQDYVGRVKEIGRQRDIEHTKKRQVNLPFKKSRSVGRFSGSVWPSARARPGL